METNRAHIVVWELTRACKLSCTNCAIGALPRRAPMELSTYEAYKTIDQVVALRPEELILTGGDPLERADIYQLIDYARRRGLRPSMMVSPTALLTGASVGKLKRNGLARLIVSVDSSTPDRHDSIRGAHGQFAATLLAIRWARTAALPVEVNTLVSHRNMGDLDSLASLLGDLGVERWSVYFVVPIGGSKHLETLSPEESERVLERLQTMRTKVPFTIRTFEAPQYRQIERMDTLFISHTGEVSISPFLPVTAGNIRYQPLSSLDRSSDLLIALRDDSNLKGKCGRCEYRRTCGGSRARAYAMTGDVFAADPLCSYQPGTATGTPLVDRGGAA
ncbi:MAG TPA: radical SAM protein [Thermoanaerobaculia bacterium]